MNDESASDMVLGRQTDWDDMAKRVLGLFDQPAYIRRALRVEDAIRAIEEKIDHERKLMLAPVRRALAVWQELLRQKPDAAKLLTDRQAEAIAGVASMIDGPTSHGAIGVWTRPRRVLGQLASAIDRLNERWVQYVEAVDVSLIEQRIDEYNRYYLLEKECAFRSPRAAARGFVHMPPFDRQRLLDRHPRLPAIPL